MKQFAKLGLCALIALMALSVSAAEKKEKKKKEKPQAQELTLVGTIVKNEAPVAEEGKKAKKVAPYSLTLEDGKTVAITDKMLKKNKIDLAPMVDKKVTVKAMGFEKKAKKGTMYKIAEVTSVEEAAAEGATE